MKRDEFNYLFSKQQTKQNSSLLKMSIMAQVCTQHSVYVGILYSWLYFEHASKIKQNLMFRKILVIQWFESYETTWPASWEICMQVRKQQLELDMEQHTGSK